MQEISSNKTEILNTIDVCQVFKSLSITDRAALAELGEIITPEKGNILFSLDQEGDAFYLVIAGKLKGTINTNDRKKFQRGDIIGEVGMFGGMRRTGIIRCAEHSKLAKFPRNLVFEPHVLPCETRLNITMCLVNNLINYFYNMKESVTDLIKKGEGETIEFKQSIHPKNYNEIITSIVSMCNYKGGSILVGVKDNGEVIGTDFDKDKLMKDVEAFAESRIGSALLNMVHISFVEVNGLKIFRIDCDPADKVIFWRENDKTEYLWVRGNGVNRKLKTVREIANHLQKRRMAG